MRMMINKLENVILLKATIAELAETITKFCISLKERRQHS